MSVHPPDFQAHPGPDGAFPWHFLPDERRLKTIHPFGLVQCSLNQHLEDFESVEITPDSLEKFTDFSINDLLPTLGFIRADLVEKIYAQIQDFPNLKTTQETHTKVLNLIWSDNSRMPEKYEETEALLGSFITAELLPRIQKLLPPANT